MRTPSLMLAAAAGLSLLSPAADAPAQVAADAANPAASSVNTVKKGDRDGAFVEAGRFSERTGQQIYARVCAGCHMPDARGAAGAGAYPALAGNPSLSAGAYPVMVVLRGLNGMPAFGGMLTDQQVAEVVNHVRTNYGNRYRDKVTAAEVKAAR